MPRPKGSKNKPKFDPKPQIEEQPKPVKPVGHSIAFIEPEPKKVESVPEVKSGTNCVNCPHKSDQHFAGHKWCSVPGCKCNGFQC